MTATSKQLVSPDEFASIYQAWSQSIRDAIELSSSCAIVGIKRRGACLARRLRKDFDPGGTLLHYGELDISLYRDDYHLQDSSPAVLGTEIDFGVDATSIVLVDDVLYTGRTVRAAMDLLLDFGRPRRIWLAVLIDRGHRELPIASDFTGREISTGFSDRVVVDLTELGDAADGVKVLSGET